MTMNPESILTKSNITAYIAHWISEHLDISLNQICIKEPVAYFGMDTSNSKLLMTDLKQKFNLFIAKNMVHKSKSVESIVTQLLASKFELAR